MKKRLILVLTCVLGAILVFCGVTTVRLFFSLGFSIWNLPYTEAPYVGGVLFILAIAAIPYYVCLIVVLIKLTRAKVQKM